MLPKLKIAHMLPRIPVIQGGMAVKVSTGRLAAAVANAGGIGTIAGTGLTDAELRSEIQTARSLSDGYIGVNVLFAAKRFSELMLTALREKVDFVISGAGFSRDMFQWGREHKIPVLAIVSSARLARLAEKLGAAAVVVEGKEAGGHLGTDRPIAALVPEVAASVRIPVVAAGGITDGFDIARMLRLGASGVQMATRFVASRECEAHANFKAQYLAANAEDVTLIDSPVGLPGRAISNHFTRSIAGALRSKIQHCDGCLKHCSAKFCILDALRKAVSGDTQNGLVFSGEFVGRIKEILPVQEIMDRLVAQMEQAFIPEHSTP
ncbi:NAD(P)H-dependent flavin oxidoreductase YrpB (nitropropane dioxygenase family) [Hydrogenispora ethanolica]|uniref:Probable nitronate monooxygenase n=1 Tax=Hydrogenispora ethanolica TaxID=1082276 RepID=A0A4R1QRU8_HYDET|nr:NAD(P)H-dependent flavin oxidoreductase YrpB (nitropropane dioxygenase family) [Hydrogenispora ethanolica]